MPITRKFLGLAEPPLHLVVQCLAEGQGNQVWDLSNLVTVVPGRGAGRRLLELLAAHALDRGVSLVPPMIETVGRVAERLYTPRRPFASDLTQELAWTHVLREAGDRLEPLWPTPPAAESPQWRELGALLRRQHRELAADGLDFADVAKQVKALGNTDEFHRWQTLAALQFAYHELLDGLELWDRQTARLKAIQFKECSTESQILLVGTVDMNVALRQMLDEVSEQVTALIFAPSEWADRFDEHGCLIPAKWRRLALDLRDEQVQVVDGPQDQAAAVVKTLAGYAGRYHADDITLGVPDVHLVPEIQRQLESHGVHARWGPGVSLATSSPYLLLSAIRDYVSTQRFAEFAHLVRHPDVGEWLSQRGLSADWNLALDRYRSRHLPSQVPDKWWGAGAPLLQSLSGLVHELVAPLLDGSHSLADWKPILGRLLMEVYEQRQFDRDSTEGRLTMRCCQRIVEALDEQAAVPSRLAPSLRAGEILRLVLEVVGRDAVAAEAQEGVEMLGWLELPLDDAPALVVTNFNEGFIPESVNSDIFLPNMLRSTLGLLDNDRRYARDAYSLQVLQSTRESLQFIVGRRTAEGDPLPPSRLLFATDPETAVRRTKNVFGSAAEESPLPAQPRDESDRGLPIPEPQPLGAEMEELSVTSFRDYLACPYRFYLRHVLKLRSVDDSADELDGAGFGTLAHEVLRRFAVSDQRDSTQPAEIERVLDTELSKYVAACYGSNVMPAVRVQVEQLRLRLAAFAECQAAWAADGWRIEHVESEEGLAVPFEVDGRPIRLRGKIDRIDVHAESGRRVILDYKTSDLPKKPEQTHRSHGTWVDLQLPLYRHLATALGIESDCELGLVLLPRDTNRIEFSLANWSESQLADADDVAREVVRAVRAENFWPPTEPPPDFSEEFAAICQDRVES